MMDILNCQLLNVGGRPYRIVGSASVASLAPLHADAYKGTAPRVANDDEEYDEDDVSAFEVKEDSSEYVIRLAYDAEVPSLDHYSQTLSRAVRARSGLSEDVMRSSNVVCTVQILPHLIGQKGKTKLKVEQDTGATVTIPKKNSTALPGSRDADVVVRGPTTSAAVSAATRLELLVENVLNSNKYALCFGSCRLRFLQKLSYFSGSSLYRLEYSHFVSIPLNSSATQAAFNQFKSSVTGDPQAAKAHIEDSIFVSTKQMHLTVIMLKLYSEQKRHLAKQVRHSCSVQAGLVS